MPEKGLTKNQIITELVRSPHGKLTDYGEIAIRAAKEHPEFFAHLIAWNAVKGAIRDSKVALPVLSLGVQGYPDEFVDNSLAHLAQLNPREFLKGYRFSLDRKTPHRSRQKRLVEAYLRHKEKFIGKWQRMAIQHRCVLKELYALSHTKPAPFVDEILFKQKYPVGSLFETVAKLKDMAPVEAAGAIMELKLPFLVAIGALGAKAKEPALVQALIQRMTPTELVTSTKMLERLGMKTNPALRGEFEKALERTSKSKQNVLKTQQAIDAVADPELKQKMRGVQERQLSNTGVEGNWLVLADKSGSMKSSIEVARQLSATLAKMVKGKVWLTFFDTTPQTIDVSGAALDVIQKATKYISAGGGTSIGCGLQRMLDEKTEVDGIAIVSDGAEHSPPYFHETYQKYSKFFDKEVPIYFYQVEGEPDSLSATLKRAGIDVQAFDLIGSKLDYYSLPNLVATMRTNRYSLVDEIMATRLLTLEEVLNISRKEVAHA